MMKLKTTIFFLLLWGVSYTQTTLPERMYDYGMNCDNTYRNRTGETTPTGANNEDLEPAKPEDLEFTGEYQIFLRRMMVGTDGRMPDDSYLKVVTIEAVSFPFVPDYGNLGFTSGSPRNCIVLDTQSGDLDTNVVYDAIHSSNLPYINFYHNIPSAFKSKISPNQRWNEVDYVHGGTPYSFNLPVYLKFSQKIYDFLGSKHKHHDALYGVNAWSVLASKFFSTSSLSTASHPYTIGSGTGDIYMQHRIVFPHTVLKHTFWIVNGNTGDTTSYSYIVDWTRGIFRSYPFVPCGDTSYEVEHDITMDAWLKNTASLEDTTCSRVGYVPNTNAFPDSLVYLYPSVLNSDIVGFEVNGPSRKIPLGYISTSGTPPVLIPHTNTPCYHTYNIDKSIDLTKINPIEKVIYHPSEAIVKSGVGLLFPSCYIFRTVRSTYPKSSDMAMLDPNNPNGWNTIHNGGPYHDLREIPIPTDLGSATDPSDSSVYIIESGASITLQDGVTVYDCTFKVKPGGSIINYDSKEVAGRFKIQWLDGSNNVVSTFTLHRGRVQKHLIELNNLTIDADVIFEADIIRAGDNVGVYVTPGGNRVVTFKGVNEVKLGANFQAKPRGNGTFYSYTGNRCNRNTSAKY